MEKPLAKAGYVIMRIDISDGSSRSKVRDLFDVESLKLAYEAGTNKVSFERWFEDHMSINKSNSHTVSDERT